MELKEHNGKKYTGCNVGFNHKWNYEDCQVTETKKEPDRWQFKMTSIKRKQVPTQYMGSVEPKTKYMWYFVGKQTVEKLDANSYSTELIANKYKLAHKRPHWKRFSCEYPEQLSENQMKMKFLSEEMKQIIKDSPNIEKQTRLVVME